MANVSVGPTIEQVPNAAQESPVTPVPPPPSASGPAPRQVSAPAPVALKQRRSWRPGLMLLGLFLVVGSMLGGILLLDSVTTTTSVLVAAGDMERGHVVQVSDVRVAEISVEPDLNVLRLDEQRFLGGASSGQPVRVLRGFVPAGTVLSEDHFIEESVAIGPSQALTGVRLESGQYPSALKVGDEVDLFAVQLRSGEADATPIGRAEVWRIWQSVSADDRTEDLVADLLIQADLQPAVVQAHADDALRITIVRSG